MVIKNTVISCTNGHRLITRELCVLCIFRIRIVKEGRKRKLIINEARVTDGGLFACTTNADRTEAELIIKCEYSSKFLSS